VKTLHNIVHNTTIQKHFRNGYLETFRNHHTKQQTKRMMSTSQHFT